MRALIFLTFMGWIGCLLYLIALSLLGFLISLRDLEVISMTGLTSGLIWALLAGFFSPKYGLLGLKRSKHGLF